jgi:hypothetical protein
MATPIEPRSLEAAERQLEIALPDAFRNHLLAGTVQIAGLDDEWELATASDIVQLTREARKWDGFPQGAVVVGSDEFGNYLVFLPSERDPSVLSPDLFAWWHEGGQLESMAGSLDPAHTRERSPRGNSS